ncbi:MAG: hypothetical protein NTV92_00345, partial [Candidatus Bipolaricaulota bacterium]|nr:hypothetical protein [Candidatus Bipolaricaulota bacterium]
LALIFLGLALVVCVVLAASESMTNRTGRTAIAVTVTFSEQVRITSYDESVFPTKEPSGRSETFRVSGGQLENGARLSISWTPSTAEITNTEWETTGAASSGSTASSAPLTYEEIMAQIAHYPGPDEPLYVPAEGEQIWLTDLEGHADIYDNDSIKINYAPSFDKSQITKIEVYRNDIKMRFVPALFDVLTNDQMKTFDGNPAENTPASNHTDHAIFDYDYQLRFVSSNSSTNGLRARSSIRSPVSVRGARSLWLYIPPSDWGPRMQETWGEQDMRARLAEIRGFGFTGAQISVVWFVDGQRANRIMAQYDSDPTIHPYLTTADDDAVHRMLRLVEEASLDCYLRLEIIETQRSSRSGNYGRGNIE